MKFRTAIINVGERTFTNIHWLPINASLSTSIVMLFRVLQNGPSTSFHVKQSFPTTTSRIWTQKTELYAAFIVLHQRQHFQVYIFRDVSCQVISLYLKYLNALSFSSTEFCGLRGSWEITSYNGEYSILMICRRLYLYVCTLLFSSKHWRRPNCYLVQHVEEAKFFDYDTLSTVLYM